MELSSWIQPGVIIGLMVFVWRDLKQDMRNLSNRMDRLSNRMDRLDQRFDRHLEGHP